MHFRTLAALCGCLFLAAFTLTRSFTAPQQEKSTAAPEQVKLAGAGSLPIALQPLPQVLAKKRASAGAIFSEIYRNGLSDFYVAGAAHARVWREFRAPYPEKGKYPSEHAVLRLGLLKVLQRDFPVNLGAVERKRALDLYRFVITNKQEMWIITRQALQNALLHSRFLSEKERAEWLAISPHAAILTANKTEEALSRELAGHATR